LDVDTETGQTQRDFTGAIHVAHAVAVIQYRQRQKHQFCHRQQRLAGQPLCVHVGTYSAAACVQAVRPATSTRPKPSIFRYRSTRSFARSRQCLRRARAAIRNFKVDIAEVPLLPLWLFPTIEGHCIGFRFAVKYPALAQQLRSFYLLNAYVP